METINPDRTLLNLYVPSGFSCANRCLKLRISKKPEIWPVSYPKMTPPIETNAPSNTDLHVTHGTRDSSRLLPLFSRSAIADSPDKSVNGGDLVPVPPPRSLLRNGIFILEMGDWRCIQYVEYVVSCVNPGLSWLRLVWRWRPGNWAVPKAALHIIKAWPKSSFFASSYCHFRNGSRS